MRERLRRYRDAGIDTLRAGPVGDDLDTRLGRLLDLVRQVNAEAVRSG